ERARSAGGRILSELEDNPAAGQRQYRAEDLEGHRWMFAQAVSPPRIARVLVLAYFEPDDLPKLIRAIRATRTPPDTSIYVGSYGVNGPVSRQGKGLVRGRCARLFPVNTTS